MPIWMTETGYDSAGPFGTTEAIQAARLPRVVMLCLANGVDKVFVYRESGSTPSMHACSGVLRDDSSRKPSWYTFGTLIRQFQGVQGGARRLPCGDDNVWLMQWNCDGQPLLTAWTVDGAARMQADLGPCNVSDSFGAVSRLESTKDLEITPYPLYIRDFSHDETLKILGAEQDRRDAAQANRLQQIAALHKYLFDFGSLENVGHANIEGYRAEYVPVLSSTVWSDAQGYGFDKPALGDEDRPWMKSEKLDRDSTKVREHLFRFRVEPGQYDLKMKIVPYSEQGQVTISGTAAGPLTLPVEKENPVTTTRITVLAQQPVVSVGLVNDYGLFTWISCIEAID